VEGGTASAVIELANGSGEPERGGSDPEVPQVMMPVRVTGRLRTAHTWDLADPDEPVWIDERADAYPGAQVADLRCPRCVTKLDIGQLDGDTIAVLQHQPGCRWLRRFLARRAS
jgi:hypothetical protein